MYCMYFTKITMNELILLQYMQVLSETVSKGLLAHVGVKAKETANFVDKFDIMNVSNYTTCIRSLKPFKKPYRSKTDFRLKVIKR